MTGRVLLDTNAVIALLAHDEGLELEILDADEVFVTTTILGELYFGAAKSSQVDENTAVRRFHSRARILLHGAMGRKCKSMIRDKDDPVILPQPLCSRRRSCTEPRA